MNIGVLAIQGSVSEHLSALKQCGVQACEVRDRKSLSEVSGLIIPGGESTTIGKLLKLYGLDVAIIERVAGGMPVYGTCAGAIVLSKKTTGKKPNIVQLLDIDTARNAYGRQIESFSTQISAPTLSRKPIPAVFIRAPKIIRVGKNVEILARFHNEPVFVREKNILASTFHPELTNDLSVHRYFIAACARR
ncbi:pyridoxal 5'-phosphate synthase glutaminase subunit PdxT [Candidatus Peregrinibacteria bacterium]|nr:pyridoxal 5'-phosphate synthase glutaminase subunit PdxT [Candidatus Peregrinibacteria bacterium]